MKAKLLFLRFFVLIAGLFISTAFLMAQSIEIGQIATPPAIDGSVGSDWDGQPKYVVVDPTTWSPGADHNSLEDLSATWSAVWDADSLYLLFEVTDDIVTTGPKDSANYEWMNDNIEFTLNDPTFTYAYKWRFSWDRDNEHLTGAENPVGYNYVTAAVTGGYVVEVAMPWSILSNDTISFAGYPAVDKVLNAGISIADLDDPDAYNWDELSGHVMWPKGWSAGDITIKATAAVDDTPPAAPTNFVSSKTTYNSADLTWDASTEGDVVAFLIQANDAPIAYIADPAATSFTVQGLTPESTYTLSIKAVDPQNLSTGTEISITTGTEPEPMFLEVLKYTGTATNPFDDLDYWDTQALPVNLEYQMGSANVDENDFAAFMKVAWTDNGLYMQVSVTDEDILNTDEEQPWANDNLEYHFDMGNERDGSSTEDAFDNYDPNNFQYRSIPYQTWQTGSTPAPSWTDIAVATYDYFGSGTVKIGYLLEMNFPWATLNTSSGLTFTPESDTLAFDLKVSDVDADESSATLSWSSYTHNEQYKSDAEYGQCTMVISTGINNNLADEMTLNVYPNPASDKLTVEMKEVENATLSIMDMIGRTVYTKKMDYINGSIDIDLSSVGKGMYIVTLQNENRVLKRTKIIIK